MTKNIKGNTKTKKTMTKKMKGNSSSYAAKLKKVMKETRITRAELTKRVHMSQTCQAPQCAFCQAELAKRVHMSQPLISSYATIIKKALKEAGISQAKLAKMSGLSQSHISLLVNGKIKNPDRVTLEKIAIALRKPSYYFGVPDIKPPDRRTLQKIAMALGKPSYYFDIPDSDKICKYARSVCL